MLAVSALATANSQRCIHDYMPNSFPGSNNRLAINQVRIHWESGKEATLCHSNRQKHEKSCLTETLVLQGIVTYMYRSVCDRESSNQSPYWWLIKASRTAKINRPRTHSCNLTFDPLKIKCLRASKGKYQAINPQSKALIPVTNAWIAACKQLPFGLTL